MLRFLWIFSFSSFRIVALTSSWGGMFFLKSALVVSLIVFSGNVVAAEVAKDVVYSLPPIDFSSKMTVSGCFCKKDGKLLLLLRNPDRTCGNTWCLPAGAIHLSESPISAAQRELKKTTGVQLGQDDLKLFRKFYVRLPDKDFELYLFEANLDDSQVISLNKRESSDFKWVTIEEALTMPLIPGAEIYMKLLSEKTGL